MCKVDLSKYSLDEIIAWRNTASNRVDSNRELLHSYETKIEKLDRKIHTDIRWIRKINKYLIRQVFPKRKQYEI